MKTPGRDQFNWDSSTKLSGAGSLRLTRLPSDGGGTPASWSFRPNGVDGTVYNEFYMQVAIRFSRPGLAWRSDDPGSPKVIKFAQFFENGELVVTNWKYSGFVGVVLNGSDFGGREIDSSPNDSWRGNIKVQQSAIHPSESIDGLSQRATLERIGPIRDNGGVFGGNDGDAGAYSYINGSEYLDERPSVVSGGGFPNSWAKASGAVSWEINRWVVIEVYLNSATRRAKVWGAVYGSAPRLLMDTDLSVNTLKANTSDHWRYIQLLNQSTNMKADPNRPTQNRWYDEIIVSRQPIAFPGGYDLDGSTVVVRPNPPVVAE